jgi:S1-C subfamily serine protease
LTVKTGFLMCVVSAFLGGLIALGVYFHLSGQTGAAVAESRIETAHACQARGSAQDLLPVPPQDADQRFSPDELSAIALYDNVNLGVVNISTRAVRVGPFRNRVEEEGSGSGWVLDKEGHIVTNHHVVLESDEVEVTLFNGQSYAAEIIGADPANDVAVLRINAPPDVLNPVELGSSSDLRVGQRVYAIGNPFGLERTMTTGIISSLNRTLPAKTSNRTIKNIIQLDAALNQGNSGGPLLDRQARLIGMNTAIATLTGENTGVGFAVPVNTIRRVVPELIANGRIVRASMGLNQVMEIGEGLMILDLIPGGPAEQAGLNPAYRVEIERFPGGFTQRQIKNRNGADVIRSINGQPTLTAEQFLEVLDGFRPGETIVVGLLRQGREMEVRIELVEEQ